MKKCAKRKKQTRRKVRPEKKERKICEEDRRREKGSGIGKRYGEGGTSKESPIREREREIEGDAKRWKEWEGETD